MKKKFFSSQDEILSSLSKNNSKDNDNFLDEETKILKGSEDNESEQKDTLENLLNIVNNSNQKSKLNLMISNSNNNNYHYNKINNKIKEIQKDLNIIQDDNKPKNKGRK